MTLLSDSKTIFHSRKLTFQNKQNPMNEFKSFVKEVILFQNSDYIPQAVMAWVAIITAILTTIVFII